MLKEYTAVTKLKCLNKAIKVIQLNPVATTVVKCNTTLIITTKNMESLEDISVEVERNDEKYYKTMILNSLEFPKYNRGPFKLGFNTR